MKARCYVHGNNSSTVSGHMNLLQKERGRGEGRKEREKRKGKRKKTRKPNHIPMFMAE